ncbi:MAG: lactate dehydrogenase, partial [Gammaproteobacteria bacterium]|nr:lactate dehydrogenase [Gammaproteobacteria bacterium]
IDLLAARHELVKLLAEEKTEEAFALVYRLPPDLRTVLVPFMTYISGAKTSIATANAVVDLVNTIIEGREVLVAGQVALQGECFELDTVMGMPIIVGQHGWLQIVKPSMNEKDFNYLKQVAEEIAMRIRQWYDDE